MPLAAQLGKPIRTYCMMTVIAAPTDAEAEGLSRKNTATAWTEGMPCWACCRAMVLRGLKGTP